MEKIEERKKGGTLSKLIQYWKENDFFASAIIFLVGLGIFSVIQLTFNEFVWQGDRYFHYQYAELIRTEGLDVDNSFKGVYFTKAEYPLTLYHFFLVPFTYIDNDMFGLKLSGVFIASLVVGLLFFLMRRMKISYPLLFIFIFLSSYSFIFRSMLGRAFAVAVVLTFFELHLAIKQKYKTLFFVSFLHVLIHPNSYFMPIGVVAIVEVVRYIFVRKFSKDTFLAVSLAVVFGMMFFPGFPMNLVKSLGAIFDLQKGVVSSEDVSSVEGAELRLLEPKTLVQADHHLLMMLVFGLVVAIYYYIFFKKGKTNFEKTKEGLERAIYIYSLMIFVCVTLLGLIVISGRFIDYYQIGIVLFFGLIVMLLFSEGQTRLGKKIKTWIVFSLFLIFFITASNYLINYKVNLFSGTQYTPFQKVAEWIGKKAEDEEIIFLENWDIFPVLYFFNDDVYYSMGIEPRSLLEYDEELYWKWFNINKNSYYCESKKNCNIEALRDKIMTEENKKEAPELARKRARAIVDSVRRDFKSRFIVTRSKNLEKVLSSLEGEEEYIVERVNYDGKVTVFMLAK